MISPKYQKISAEDVPPVLRRLDLFFQERWAGAYAVYRVSEGASGPELVTWGVLSRFARSAEELGEVAERFKGAALYCCKMNCDKETLPPDYIIPNPEGRRWWSLVIGSGPARAQGYAIHAIVPALHTAEARIFIANIQRIFSDSVLVSSDAIAEKKIDESRFLKTTRPEVRAILEQLKLLLFREFGAAALSVFGVSVQQDELQLEPVFVYCPYAFRANDTDTTIENMRSFVLKCCRDEIDREISSDPTQSPVNENGLRWWSLLIGSGSVRKAGFAIGATVASKDSDEALRQILKVQELFTSLKF